MGPSTGQAVAGVPATMAPSSAANRMRQRTAELHRRAEQTGVVGAILRGEATRAAYALLLRNLLPAYRELETGLARCAGAACSSSVRDLLRPELVRAQSLESDVRRLSTPGLELPLLPEGSQYASRIAAVAGDGALLIAHAYTRYLGDLAGGRLLRGRLAATLGLDAACLSFYDFPQIADAASFARQYRLALDAAAAAVDDLDRVIEEAAVAFELNIRLSEAVEAYVRAQNGPEAITPTLPAPTIGDTDMPASADRRAPAR